MTPTDTIVAVATAAADAAVAVIRLSGPDAWRITRALAPSLPESPDSHRARLRVLHDGGLRLDEALVLPFVAPRSFTGEDVVELHVHGGQVGTTRVVRALVDRGARPAEPGEFTRRALLNGRLDLLRAEGIAELVKASSEAAWNAGQALLAGRLSSQVDALRTQLLNVVVLLEAGLDFSGEEHVWQAPLDELATDLEAIAVALRALLGTWRDGRLRVEGFRVAIVGRPNAGKSTLFNVLYGGERAIVTDVAGTTRDWLEERLTLGGLLVRMVDTAGLRGTTDAVEAIGVDRARRIAAEADACLVVMEAGEAAFDETLAPSGRPCGVVVNKADDAPDAPWPTGLPVDRAVRVSLREAPELARAEVVALVERLARDAGWTPDPGAAVLVRERQRDAVKRALEGAERAREACRLEMPLEMIALDARLALDALGELVGAVTSDDILNRIFSDFCVGK